MDKRVLFLAFLALTGSALARRPLQAVVPDGAATDATPSIAPAVAPATETGAEAVESPIEAAAMADGQTVEPMEAMTPAAGGPMVAAELPSAPATAPTTAAEAPMEAAEAPMEAAEAPMEAAEAPKTEAAEAPMEAAEAPMEAAEAPKTEAAEAPMEGAEAPMMEGAEAPMAGAEGPAAATEAAASAPLAAPAAAPMAEAAAAPMEAAASAPEGGAAISTGDVPATTAGAPDTSMAAPAPAPESEEKSANLLFTMSARRATITKQGLLLEGVSPVVTYVSDVPSKHAGRFNTSYFTGDAFTFNETWLNNPDAVLMGIVTSGGTPETNGTVGTVVLKLSNPVYNASRFTVLFNSEIQTPEQNSITLQDGNANYWIDEASDKLLDITERTVLMDNAIFFDAYAAVERAAKGGAKSSVLGGGWCNPLGSLTSFGCEGVYVNGYGYNPGLTLGR